MAENSTFVFLYGTLKKEEPNHYEIEKPDKGSAVFVGPARTVKKWPLVIASRFNIPYILRSEGKGENVLGEVYEVDNVMLGWMDELENHPKYYTRMKEEVQLIAEGEHDGKIIQAWIYFLEKFRPELLQLPYLPVYSSLGSHGLKYNLREQRAGVNYYSDVMNEQ